MVEDTFAAAVASGVGGIVAAAVAARVGNGVAVGVSPRVAEGVLSDAADAAATIFSCAAAPVGVGVTPGVAGGMAAEVVAGLVIETEIGVAAGVAEGVVTGKGVSEPNVTCGNSDDAAAEALLLAVAIGADAWIGTVLCMM